MDSIWARSEDGLSRLPVTEEIAGSNPVGPAKERDSAKAGSFFLGRLVCDTNRAEGNGSVERSHAQVLAPSMA